MIPIITGPRNGEQARESRIPPCIPPFPGGKDHDLPLEKGEIEGVPAPLRCSRASFSTEQVSRQTVRAAAGRREVYVMCRRNPIKACVFAVAMIHAGFGGDWGWYNSIHNVNSLYYRIYSYFDSLEPAIFLDG